MRVSGEFLLFDYFYNFYTVVRATSLSKVLGGSHACSFY